ncbi:acetoacetate--CoA ligase [candidate division KSB1 bacterium]|nr:acetoacetate--CoA ligase [candidate division KSB1 bacterium]
MSELLWNPTASYISKTNMTALAQWLGRKCGEAFPDYSSLHQWSVDHLEAFWESYLEYTKILHRAPHQQVLDTHDMPGARWFSGMRLNFAENILARDFHGPALVYQIEKNFGEPETPGAYFGEISFKELKNLVARGARGLRQAGIKKGDRVAGYVANVPEAIVAFLACASIGAVWSSASPDFGLHALCDRFNQVQPKLIFASTHYRYGGKTFRTGEVVKPLRDKIPSAKTIVAIPYPVDEADSWGELTWQEFLGPDDAPKLSFEQVPFTHPLYILFSSGTTGAPKCMVHGTGGALLQHRKEQQLHCDLRAGDFLLFFTTCGWMMWNWQLSALSLGVKIGLYDGNPGYPDLTAIWRLVDKLGVTHFGTSGRFIESCMKSQSPLAPYNFGEMPALRSILCTGSPLSPNGFRWIYHAVKKDVHLAGISGGTDIVSCFILGNPNLPVIAGEIQCKGLGVDVAALDEEGNPVVGAPGELVCRQPLPSMPIEFLNDPDGKKYHEAYFEDYPGLWRHGDYVQFTPSGGVIVYGRSDATLNPGGVRIGSAEIYSALDALDFIAGAVVVGWLPPNQSDELIVLCVVLTAPHALDEVMEKHIRQTIREKCSPRHVPHHVFQISEVPVTRSGKTVELSVKAILAGKSVSNRSALANPQVLEEFERIRLRLSSLYPGVSKVL